MAWILFLLVGAAVTGLLVWDVRTKTAAREAATKRRFEEMFQARAAAAPAHAAPAGASPNPVAQPEASTPVPGVAAPARDRFLGQRETLLYRLLKAGIPDHEIFANVALSSVVGGRNEQEIRRISHCRLDFVVCDKGMRVVAVVEFDPGGVAQAPGDLRFIADSLKASGINLVRVSPSALPRREEIRGLILGHSGPVKS